MKHLFISAFAMVAILATGTALADTTFTYQGQLDSSNQPYNGTVEMDFLLYEDPTGGTALANDLGHSVQVTDGLFQVELDFDMVLDRAPLYLEISVDGQMLEPRQTIRPAPLAAFALNGNEGPQGEAGPQGLPGPQGETGPQGEAGPQGSQGEVGPQGAVGPMGLTGPMGQPGPTGPEGPTGATGPAGIEGPQGLPGETGPVGPIGPAGGACTVSACSPEGQAELSCADTPPMYIGCSCAAPPEVEVQLVDPPPSEIQGNAPFRLDASASTVSYCGFEVPVVASGSPDFDNCESPGQACILYEWSCTGVTADDANVCYAAIDGWDQSAYSEHYSYEAIDWFPASYVRYTITLTIYEVGFDNTPTQNSRKSWTFDTLAAPPPQ